MIFPSFVNLSFVTKSFSHSYLVFLDFGVEWFRLLSVVFLSINCFPTMVG